MWFRCVFMGTGSILQMVNDNIGSGWPFLAAELILNYKKLSNSALTFQSYFTDIVKANEMLGGHVCVFIWDFHHFEDRFPVLKSVSVSFKKKVEMISSPTSLGGQLQWLLNPNFCWSNTYLTAMNFDWIREEKVDQLCCTLSSYTLYYFNSDSTTFHHQVD